MSIFREGVGQVFSLNGGYLKIKLTAPLRFIVLSPPATSISYSGPHSASCLNQTIIINLLYILLIQLIFLEHSTFYFTNKLFKRMSLFDRLKYFRVQEEIYNNQKTQKIKVVKVAIGGNFCFCKRNMFLSENFVVLKSLSDCMFVSNNRENG